MGDTDRIQLSYEQWGSRWDEIKAYADRRGVNSGKAIVELIDKGLSHLDDD